MAQKLKFGNGVWANKEGSTLAYNDENGNYKPLPFNFTRATSATRVNKQGLIEVVRNNKPRIDYKDSTKGALILEPSRTNLFPYSEDFTQWDTAVSTVTSNSLICPDGTQNSFTLTTLAAGGTVQDTITVANGNVTFSVFVKKGTTNGVRLRIDADTDSNGYFDLVNNIIYSSDNDAKIENYGNGWYRVSISANITGFVKASIYTTNGTTSYDNGTLNIWAAQLEQGYPTSYIRTSGSAVTRVAEQGIDGGAGTPIFSNTTAVWFLDIERVGVDVDSSGRAVALRNSSFSEQIRLHFDSPSEEIRFRNALSSFATISTITGMGANVRKKIALRINGSALSTFSQGSKIGSDYTAPSAFDIEEIDFATLGFKIHDMRFYNEALTDAELQALTTI